MGSGIQLQAADRRWLTLVSFQSARGETNRVEKPHPPTPGCPLDAGHLLLPPGPSCSFSCRFRGPQAHANRMETAHRVEATRTRNERKGELRRFSFAVSGRNRSMNAMQ